MQSIGNDLGLTAASGPTLRADCANCFGLCCVVPAFAASADFAIDKPAGHACPNLQMDFRCGIHNELRQQGFPGCTVYDCFGAGQQISQVSYDGRDWRRAPETAPQMFEAFAVMRLLHELLWYLAEALSLPAARPVHPELNAARAGTERLTELDPATLLALDAEAHRQGVNALLLRTSELVRADVSGDADNHRGADHRRADYRGADLIGADLHGAELCGANLRGAYLIGANLAGADLRSADLIGADLRNADLSGANLSTTIFLTQFQVNAARGNRATRIRRALIRPPHWH